MNKIKQFIYAHTKEGWDSEYSITCFSRNANIIGRTDIDVESEKIKSVFNFNFLKDDYTLDRNYQKAYCYYKTTIDNEDIHFFGQVANRDDFCDIEEKRPKTKAIEHFIYYKGYLDRPYKLFLNDKFKQLFINNIIENMKNINLEDINEDDFQEMLVDNKDIIVESKEIVIKILIALKQLNKTSKQKIILVSDDLNQGMNYLLAAISLLPLSIQNQINYYTFQKDFQGLKDFTICLSNSSYIEAKKVEIFASNIVIDTRLTINKLENFEKREGSLYSEVIKSLITNKINDKISKKFDYINQIYFDNNLTIEQLDDAAKIYQIINNLEYNVKPFYEIVSQYYKKSNNLSLRYNERIEALYLKKLASIDLINDKIISFLKELYFYYKSNARNNEEEFIKIYKEIFMKKFFSDCTFVISSENEFVLEIIDEELINNPTLIKSYLNEYISEISLVNIIVIYNKYAEYITNNEVSRELKSVFSILINYLISKKEIYELIKNKDVKIIKIILDIVIEVRYEEEIKNEIIQTISSKDDLNFNTILDYIKVLNVDNELEKEVLIKTIKNVVKKANIETNEDWVQLYSYTFKMGKATNYFLAAIIERINECLRNKIHIEELDSVRSFVKDVYHILPSLEELVNIEAVKDLYNEIRDLEKSAEEKEKTKEIKEKIISSRVKDIVYKLDLLNETKIKKIYKECISKEKVNNYNENIYNYLLDCDNPADKKTELIKAINKAIKSKEKYDKNIVRRKIFKKKIIVALFSCLICSCIGLIELILCYLLYFMLDKKGIIVNHFNYKYFLSIFVIAFLSLIYGFSNYGKNKIRRNISLVIKWNVYTTFIPILLMVITSLILYLYL